jgi:hypothetical protein
MPTYQTNSSSETPAPAAGANVQAIEQIKAERERLGITPAILEQRRKESLARPF